MRRLAAILVVSTCAVLPALAALPPQYQRLAELQAILNDARVLDAFGTGTPFDGIELIDTDHYRVTGGKCHMEVMIVTKTTQPAVPGPRQFDVEPGELVCD